MQHTLNFIVTFRNIPKSMKAKAKSIIMFSKKFGHQWVPKRSWDKNRLKIITMAANNALCPQLGWDLPQSRDGCVTGPRAHISDTDCCYDLSSIFSTLPLIDWKTIHNHVNCIIRCVNQDILLKKSFIGDPK
jgi:hypothetical protein